MAINVCCSPTLSLTTFLQVYSSPVSRTVSTSRRLTVQSQLRLATDERRQRRSLSLRRIDGLGGCGLTLGIGKGRMSGKLEVRCGVKKIDQSRFKEEVLESDKPVLVDFVADWCGPCRLIAPVVDWISEEYKDRLKVVKIDHDASPQLIETYKVYGLPTLIIFKDGQEVPESRREGAITKIKLKDFLDSFLEKMVVS